MHGDNMWWYRRISGYRDDFSQEKLIGNFQFGKVYRGMRPNGKQVTVKLMSACVFRRKLNYSSFSCTVRKKKDRRIIGTLSSSKNVTRILYVDGCSWFMIWIHSIQYKTSWIYKDTFTWHMRLKVAFGVASVLKFLHAQNPDVPYLIRNVAAAHIMLDQEQEPVLFDFSMISGGILYDKRNILNEPVNGCHGYVDPTSARPGAWSDKCDVFSYGVLLLQLVSKVVDLDARLVTKLALHCVHKDPRKRPSMKQVYKHLLKLNVAQSDAAIKGNGSKLSGDASKLESDELLVLYNSL
ncbi:hypothetical protein Tsubulata_036771 [Turnera subulata]|uniref:Protein kinase domain-containing protein n=1 Tax=Turnera subulata TaxID=218843 RepID=A0A9Q0FR24_9ROSI|nr:hypothetical protein Tsubulata_036771 [Turnera subulata]